MSDIKSGEALTPGELKTKTDAQIAKFSGQLPDQSTSKIQEITQTRETAKAERDLARVTQTRIAAAEDELRNLTPKVSQKTH